MEELNILNAVWSNTSSPNPAKYVRASSSSSESQECWSREPEREWGEISPIKANAARRRQEIPRSKAVSSVRPGSRGSPGILNADADLPLQQRREAQSLNQFAHGAEALPKSVTPDRLRIVHTVVSCAADARLCFTPGLESAILQAHGGPEPAMPRRLRSHPRLPLGCPWTSP